tara:strand:- start:154 stop:429 length:276 start_codon:yes stop_codon:yes gene_type:complete
MKKLLDAITSSFMFLGKVGGSIVSFLVYGLIGIFFLWLIKGFGAIFINADMITSDYLTVPYYFVFIEQFDITQLVFFVIFGLLGALKFWKE